MEMENKRHVKHQMEIVAKSVAKEKEERKGTTVVEVKQRMMRVEGTPAMVMPFSEPCYEQQQTSGNKTEQKKENTLANP